MSRVRMNKSELAALEERAREHVASVPYSVSLRWVFYRLLQDGIYSKKDDWVRWKQVASKFRHNGTWPPDFLEDATREVVVRGLSRAWSEENVIENMLDAQTLSAYFKESHFEDQENYAEVWFEARAMQGQFEQYTRGVVLRPFGGDYSIGPKYQAAQDLMQRAHRFGKSVKILYFGDLDEKGRKIFTAATTGPKGLMKWCDVPVELIWCGLTEEQVEHYEVPENPDKPGEFQWEALTDPAASEIIRHGIQKYLDLSIIGEMDRLALERSQAFVAKLRERLDGWGGER